MKHQIVEIKKIVEENMFLKTFFLDLKMDYKPGQFVMLWLPGLDEKPFSLSYTKPFGVTVEKKGLFTEKMFKMKAGDKIGVRGPYGNGFTIKDNAIVVAGGCGYAPVAPLIEKLKNPTVIFGCKSKNRIIFHDRFKKLKPKICTDDGTFGYKCFSTELLGMIIKEKKPKIVYTCGPEVMMRKIFEICERPGIECQASLERMMFCGFGVCASCVCGDKLVCKDGPVFNSAQLRKLEDFGNSAKLRSGKKVSLNEYYAWRSK